MLRNVGENVEKDVAMEIEKEGGNKFKLLLVKICLDLGITNYEDVIDDYFQKMEQ